jgi:hypothetical protein
VPRGAVRERRASGAALLASHHLRGGKKIKFKNNKKHENEVPRSLPPITWDEGKK